MQRTRELNNGRPRRSQSQHRGQRTAAPPSSTQLVLYDPDQAPNHRRGGPTPPTAIRSGGVRSTYKVLPVVIGTGSFGTVRSCIHRASKTKLAIKSVSLRGKAPASAELIRNEVALLQRVKHRHIVRVVDIMQDREYIHIVMEQCRGGDLFDMTVDGKARLGEGRIRKIVGSLLTAIAYLHERDIVHRDLKAEHLMFSTGDMNSPIKIIDFGVATVHRPGDAPMTAFAGSVRSVAPEVVRRSYGKECDLWSCGVITYFLLMRQMPFDSPTSDPEEIFDKIRGGRFLYPQWAATGVTEEAKDFIDRLLVVDPRQRLTAKQALSHPWISNKKVKKVKQPSRTQGVILAPRPAVSNRPRGRRR